MTIPQYPKTRGLTFGEAWDAVASGNGTVRAASPGTFDLEPSSIVWESHLASPRLRISNAPASSIGIREWNLSGDGIDLQPSPVEFSGPDALAVVMREPCEWEARLTEASGWLPFDLSIESSWHRWNAVTLQHCTFRRRVRDQFEGLELPEGWAAKAYSDGSGYYVTPSAEDDPLLRFPVGGRTIASLQAELAVAERLAELERGK